MWRWLGSRVERVLGRINRLFPALEDSVAQHALDHRPRNVCQLEQLWHRERPALRLEQHPDHFFFLAELLFRSSRGAFPCDHALRPPLSLLHTLSDIDHSP